MPSPGMRLVGLSIQLLLYTWLRVQWKAEALVAMPPSRHQKSSSDGGAHRIPLDDPTSPSSGRVIPPWTEKSNLSTTRREPLNGSKTTAYVTVGSTRRLVLQTCLLSSFSLVGVESCCASATTAAVSQNAIDSSTAARLSSRSDPLGGKDQREQVSLAAERAVGQIEPLSSVSAALAATTVTTAATATATAVVVVPPIEWNAILTQASKKALGGGKAGASASVVQVCTLMWLRTSMNYQYRYGGNLTSSLQTLWNEGGIGRLYQGLPFALVQGPLTRFGDTAANIGIMALLQALPATQEWPLPLKTAFGSAAAGVWRIFLMPIDASKTALQVEGPMALERLWASTVPLGPGVLYRGALAQAAATAVGHFPWFLTYNYLDEILPLVVKGEDNAVLLGLARSAVLGFSASCVSDCASNSLRVIKTTKQTAQLSNDTLASNDQDLSYPEVVKMIVEKDGLAGLFGRGLQTRLLTNAIQGAMFSILWKYFQQINGV